MAVQNWWPTVFGDLEAAINAAWPERTVYYYVSDFERFPWQTRWTENKLTAPFALINLPEWGASPNSPTKHEYYVGDVSLFYIAADHADIDATLTERLNAMEDELRNATFNSVEVLPVGFRLNWGANNPFNTYKQKIPLTGGAITFRARVPGSSVEARP